MEIVKIEWLDARTDIDIAPMDFVKEKLEGIHFTTVGFLIENNKKYVKVTSMLSENNDCKYTHIIPKCLVKKITELKEVRK